MKEMNKEMENNINGNACKMNGKIENKMDENMQTLRGEMQSMGLGLQAGQKVMRTSMRSIKAMGQLRGAKRGRWSAKWRRHVLERTS